jgi:hypothetical protein
LALAGFGLAALLCGTVAVERRRLRNAIRLVGEQRERIMELEWEVDDLSSLVVRVSEAKGK